MMCSTGAQVECVRERERRGEAEGTSDGEVAFGCVSGMCVCVCVCVRGFVCMSECELCVCECVHVLSCVGLKERERVSEVSENWRVIDSLIDW
jgi:hypothetical protein